MKMFEQSRSAIPQHPGRRRGEVVAKSRRQRDRSDGQVAQSDRKGRKLPSDPLEAALLETNEVHLVDSQYDLANSEQRANEGVSLGLRQDPFARIYEDNGEITS